MKGSETLRSEISHLYSTESSSVPVANIITTPGASLANFLVLYALLGPGDHAIVQYPTYQQLYSVPHLSGQMSVCGKLAKAMTGSSIWKS